MNGDQPSAKPLCPSAQPDWEGAVLIGVVLGTAGEPRVRFAQEAAPVVPEVLALATPVHPTEIFRFAAPCLCRNCVHFENVKCRLVERVVSQLPIVVDDPPPCPIRPSCRWWSQEGIAACRRCPQVVTDNHNPAAEMVQAASPASRKQPGPFA